MTIFGWVLFGYLTLWFLYTLVMVFFWPEPKAKLAKPAELNPWFVLTDEDQEWFKRNLWDGKRVIDPTVPEPQPVKAGPPPARPNPLLVADRKPEKMPSEAFMAARDIRNDKRANCKHKKTASTGTISDTYDEITCLDCGAIRKQGKPVCRVCRQYGGQQYFDVPANVQFCYACGVVK